MNPISLCMIVKNEASTLEPLLERIRPHVAEICILDTGSTDGTQEIAQKWADKFATFQWVDDFAAARTASYELATQPWILWVDGDDQIEGVENLGTLIREAPQGKPHQVVLAYEYAHDPQGRPTLVHWRERLTQRTETMRWTMPVHECLVPSEPTSMSRSNLVRLVHKRQESKKVVDPFRNLRILQRYHQAHPEDVRTLYYLGLENCNVGAIREGMGFLRRYIQRSGWEDEKFLAHLELARWHQHFQEWDEAAEWGLKAVAVKELWGEAYFSLGKSAYYKAKAGDDPQRNFERATNYFKLGLSCPETQTILWTNPLERLHEVPKHLGTCLHRLGDSRQALEVFSKALEVVPEDSELRTNVERLREQVAKDEIETQLNVLLGLGRLDLATAKIARDVVRGNFTLRQHPGSLAIAIYVGPGPEAWNPETMSRTGQGGSEVMAWEMARRLARLGNSVTIYGFCPDDLEGTFEGVRFLNFHKFRDFRCDVLITSRKPHAVDPEHNVPAAVRLCWVHDVGVGELTEERAQRFDRFLCLSEWHRQTLLNFYPFVREDQVAVTRNGIDFARWEIPTVERNPHQAIYSSSPDRGLKALLECWPAIRAEVPDATLLVAYGFHNWEASARLQGDEPQLRDIQALKDLMASLEPMGVKATGRVNQQELAKMQLGSGVWAYPTWFTETFCITAAEALAAGLAIVTSPIAALPETVGLDGTYIAGDWLSKEYQAEFTKAVVSAMQNPPDREALQARARERFGLDELARDWDKMLKQMVSRAIKRAA